ncbi:MAG TPA: glycerophosphodiester phosphodiesterase [Candidatus Angelobacter sp.]|nr:glycerophosphodiester phosphodiesterase [Candidatus Angelobacter sp.]
MPAQLLLLGHRGARLYAPENTIAAFDLALEHGADGFEFDVRSTSNKQSIITHDPRLNRIVIRRHTFKQLQETFASPALAPPSLEDVLDRFSRTAFLNIEVKVRGIEPLVARAVKRVRPRRGYFISSFLPSVVRRLHAIDSSLVLGTLAQTRWQLRRWRLLPATYVVPHYRLLSLRLVKKLHAAGKTVVTWTVNDARRMRRFAQMGVDGIISDDTRLLVETLKET